MLIEIITKNDESLKNDLFCSKYLIAVDQN